jgi:hypothetical protein
MGSFIQWCQHLALAEAIRSVSWPYPAIEIVHICGLVMVFGSILVLNLRIFGAYLTDTPSAEIADDLAPWTLVGLAIQVVSGPLLFITSAERFSESTPFLTKLVLLVVALIYHFAVHRNSSRGRGPLPAKASALISMVLWIGVILAGLGIELLA